MWLVLVRFLLNERRNEPDVASDKAVRRMRKRVFRTERSCVYMDDKVTHSQIYVCRSRCSYRLLMLSNLEYVEQELSSLAS